MDRDFHFVARASRRPFEFVALFEIKELGHLLRDRDSVLYSFSIGSVAVGDGRFGDLDGGFRHLLVSVTCCTKYSVRIAC